MPGEPDEQQVVRLHSELLNEKTPSHLFGLEFEYYSVVGELSFWSEVKKQARGQDDQVVDRKQMDAQSGQCEKALVVVIFDQVAQVEREVGDRVEEKDQEASDELEPGERADRHGRIPTQKLGDQPDQKESGQGSHNGNGDYYSDQN